MEKVSNSGPQFNALNGKELIEYLSSRIAKDVEDKLVLSGEFKEALTFPWIKYDFKLSVLSYPQQDVNDEPKIKIEGVGSIQQVPLIPPEQVSDKPIEILVDRKEVIDTPDKARVDSNQPTTVPAPGPGGVLIDKPVPPKKVPEKVK